MIFNFDDEGAHMPRFSANLGFLWTDYSLPEAIIAAHTARFDAVECHWPYSESAGLVQETLQRTGLPMLVLNTPRGNINKGEFGLAALPERKQEAKQGIMDAIAYACQIGASAVHVMAGKAIAKKKNIDHLTDMLVFAANEAAPHGIEIWIEAINPIDVPGYVLNKPRDAVDILSLLSIPNLGLMFDCYHVGRMGEDIIKELDYCLPWIRHVQIAGIPDRTEPDQGSVNFQPIYHWLDASGYDGFIGAEYRPRGNITDGLRWLEIAQN